MCDLGKANDRTSMEAEANRRGKQKQTFKLLTKKTIRAQHTIQQRYSKSLRYSGMTRSKTRSRIGRSSQITRACCVGNGTGRAHFEMPLQSGEAERFCGWSLVAGEAHLLAGCVTLRMVRCHANHSAQCSIGVNWRMKLQS